MKKSRYPKHQPFNRFRLFFLFTIFAISVTYAYTDRHNLLQRLQPPAQATVGTLNIKATTGTQLMPGNGVWNSTGIGIGTTNPSSPLHLYGNSANPALYIQQAGSGAKFQVGSSADIYVSNAGNVGIGTTNPSEALLQIAAAGSTVPSLRVGKGSVGSLSLTPYQTSHLYSEISTGSTENIVLMPGNGTGVGTGTAANVGIGTAAPNYKLHLLGSSAAGFGSPQFLIGGRALNQYTTMGFGYVDATNTNPPAEIGYLETNNAGTTLGDLVFGTRSVTTNTAVTERMRIKSGGYVGIGLNDPGAVLEVTGNANILGIIRMTQRVSGAAAYGLDIGLDPGTGNPVFSGIANGTVTNALSIGRASGNVGIGTTNPLALLHVKNGRIRIEDATGPELDFLIGSDDYGQIYATTGGLNLSATQASTGIGLYWRDGSSVQKPGIILKGSGSVGIGTTAPNQQLELATVGGSNRLRFKRTDNTVSSGIIETVGSDNVVDWSFGINQLVGDAFEINESGTTNRLTIIKGGYVGIGTTNPLSTLSVGAAGGANIGVYGYASSFGIYGNGSTGVYGDGTVTGVSGYTNTVGGIGVKGVSTTGYGVYGEGNVVGVYGYTSTGSGGYGVYGSAGALGYDFYAAGSGTNYGPFTGGHEVKFEDNFPEKVKQGSIVSVTGETQVRKGTDGETTISSTLPTIRLSNYTNDKTVFGVFEAEAKLPPDHWYKPKKNERFGIVNALGEGRALVTNINGNIHAGDYITTSPLSGYGQKQNDDLLHSYTLGKATEKVDWDNVKETIEFNGKVYKIMLIAVVYVSG